MMAERRANYWTAWSVLAAMGFVIGAFLVDYSLVASGLVLLITGIVAQVGTSLLGFALLRPAIRRQPWALIILIISAPVVSIAVAAYVAGVFVLFIAAVKSVWYLFT